MMSTNRDADADAALVAYRIANAPKRPWPYAHICPENLLPPDLFEELRAMEIPEGALVQHRYDGALSEEEQFRYSTSIDREAIKKGTEFHPSLLHTYHVLSQPIVVRRLVSVFLPELQQEFGTPALPLRPALMFVEDRSGYALLPHTDVDNKAVTLLIYLADDGANPDLGTEIYLPRALPKDQSNLMLMRLAREHVDHVATVPYRPNQAVAFAPSMRTFHGVARTETGDRTRRLLQFQLIIADPRVRRQHAEKKAGG